MAVQVGREKQSEISIAREQRVLEETSGIKGTGLGLWLVRHFIEGHGGHIWVESDFGHGSTFHFWLPFTPPEGSQSVEEDTGPIIPKA